MITNVPRQEHLPDERSFFVSWDQFSVLVSILFVDMIYS